MLRSAFLFAICFVTPALFAEDQSIIEDRAKVLALAAQVERIPDEGEVDFQWVLRELVEFLLDVANPAKASSRWVTKIWIPGAPVAPYFESQLLLFKGLWPELVAKKAELEGTNGPWDRGFRAKAPPPKIDLLLEMATEFGHSGWSLFRDSLEKIHRVLNKKVRLHFFNDWSLRSVFSVPLSDRGLKDLLKGSQAGENLAALLPQYFNREAREIDAEFLALVKRALALADDDINGINALRKELEVILRRQAYLSQWVDGLLRKWIFVLQDFTRTKRANMREFSTLSETVRGLGAGLKDLRERALAFRRDRQVPFDFSTTNSPFYLSDPYRDLASLWSGGINSPGTLWSWPKAVIDADGESAFQFYDQLLIMQYLFGAGVVISSLTNTAEGKASFGEWLSIAASSVTQKLPWVTKPSENAGTLQVGAHSLAMPTLPSARLPLALQNRRGEAEATLWKIFFEAAGLKEEDPTDHASAPLFAMSQLRSLCEVKSQ